MTTKFAPTFMGYEDETGTTDRSEALLDYRIDLPPGFGDIDNTQISFVKVARAHSAQHELQQMTEKAFLESNYVMLKWKPRKFGGAGPSKLLVYHLKDLQKPLVSWSRPDMVPIQCSFVIKEKHEAK